MKLAVVGVTGLVGNVMLQVLEESGFPVSEFIPVASAKSRGSLIEFKGKTYPVVTVEEAIALKPQIAIFSAGGTVSLNWAPAFADVGTTVIDNSSAWRMDPAIRLVVPEINASLLSAEDKIIANPNCSTIQMVMALAPLHRAFRMKRLVISTYQSFTGTGAKAVAQYEAEKAGISLSADQMAYHYPIFENAIPQCDVFLDNGYTKEEMKLVHETRKILGDESIQITATAVRIPVNGGHSESVNVEFETSFDLNSVRSLLEKTPGIVVQDDLAHFSYPMPLFARNKNDVFVGRIRRDESVQHGLNLWIVADNLRKGAATNAIQIASYLIENNLIST
jgi:aspartate-semialdehyde dehydrogenase